MGPLVFRLLISLWVVGLTVARAEPDGLYEPEVKWTRTEITVCWSEPSNPNAAFTDAEKLEIKKYIQQEFTSERTGIHFVGFETCKGKTRYDVFIDTDTQMTAGGRGLFFYYEPGRTGQAVMGEGGMVSYGFSATSWLFHPQTGYLQKSKGPYRLYLYYNRYHRTPNAPPMFKVKMTALHEFGHIAGLRHEHARPEALNDPNCDLRRTSDPTFKDREPIYDTTKMAGPYDPNSIMNYCWEDVLDWHGPKWFLIRDLTAFHKAKTPPIEEAGAKLTPDSFPWIADSTLFSGKKDYLPGVDLYYIRPGLSAQDVRAIQCMYKKPAPKGCEQHKPFYYR